MGETKNIIIMRSKIKEKVVSAKEKIERFKVKLDYKTTITIRNLEALDLWKEKYPNAKVIGSTFE